MADAYFTGGAEAIYAIDAMMARVQAATGHAVGEAAALIERTAKENSSGRPGPNVQTGAHRRGIITEGPKRTGANSWVASVRPTMVYSRALERGHPRWPPGRKFPYLEPAVKTALVRIPALFNRAWSSAMRRGF